MAYVLGVTAFGAGLPTPLYSIYEHQFDFSPTVLGAIFATYTLGVLLTMYVLAPQADLVGTHPVLYLGMLTTALSGIVFLLAGGYGIAGGVLWLAGARFVSGLAVGATTSTATLSMTKREPNADKHHVARVAVGANFGGVACGVLLSSVAVAFVPHPTEVVFFVLIATAGVGALLLRLTPKLLPHEERPERVRFERIRVPRAIRGPFWVAVAGLTACYAIYGFFASLAPTAVHDATHLPPSAAAASVAVMFASAALVQIFLGQVRDRNALLTGLPLMVLSLVLFVASMPLGLVVLSLASAVLMGVAVGFVYMGSVTLVDRVAPDELRGEILSGFHLSGYLALAVPTLTLAVVASELGVVNSGILFGGALGAVVFLSYLATRRTPIPPGGGGWPRGSRAPGP
jgi:MFS family permease